MSMRYYPVHQYGVLLTREDFENVGADFEKWEEKLEFSSYYDFEGEFEFYEKKDEERYVGLTDVEFTMVYPKKYPTFFERAYIDMDWLVAELKERMVDYPFDVTDEFIKNRFGELTGVIYG